MQDRPIQNPTFPLITAAKLPYKENDSFDIFERENGLEVLTSPLWGRETTRQVYDAKELKSQSEKKSVDVHKYYHYVKQFINKDSYIIAKQDGRDWESLAEIKVYDAKSDTVKDTINITNELKDLGRLRFSKVNSATLLQNGKAVIITKSNDIILFRYADGKLSDVKLLDIKNDCLELKWPEFYVFPVSEDRFLTIFANRSNMCTENYILLQLWDSHTGERIGQSVKIAPADNESIAPIMLPNGSIVCVAGDGTTGSQNIVVIDTKTLTWRTYDLDCHMKAMKLLKNDHVVIISSPNEWYFHGSEIDIRIFHIPELLKYKEKMVVDEIMACTQFSPDPVSVIANYVADDFLGLTKTQFGLFAPRVDSSKTLPEVQVNPLFGLQPMSLSS
ncbi:MAG: hypothetical protein ACYCQI_07790 [Gammaproteobacteria bacterium]